MKLHAHHSQSNFAKIDVSGPFRMLLGLDLALQQAVAIDASEREAIDVRELARRFGLLGELLGLHVHVVILDREHSLRRFTLEKVVIQS